MFVKFNEGRLYRIREQEKFDVPKGTDSLLGGGATMIDD